MLRRASTKIAHNSTIPVLGSNHDLKPLQNLIVAEKAVLISLKKLSVEYCKASDALQSWGLSEGNDLGDILSASTSLLKIFSSALVEYASHGDYMRKQLKVIRTKEESLDNLKRCRHNSRRKAKNADKKLSKMDPENKNFASQKESFVHLQEEIRKMDLGILSEETALYSFKRTATKEWMGLKFGGLVECCQKGTIAGEFGKLAISELSEEPIRPGMPQRPTISSDSQVEGLVEKANQCVNAIVLSVVPSEGFRDGVRHWQHNGASLSFNSPTASSHVSPPPTSREPLSVPQQQPSPTSSTLPVRPSRDSNEINLQPVRRRKGQPPDTPVSPVDSSSEYVPPYEHQPSQGKTVRSSQSSPSTQQQPGVNEDTVNGCSVHRSNTVTVKRLTKAPVVNNTSSLPSTSKSKGNHSPQDPSSSSSSGRHSHGHSHHPSSSMAGTSQLTPNRRRFEIDWTPPSEVVTNNSPMDSGGDEVYSDEPPPSFNDALLERTYVPGVRQSSEGSHANTAGHHHSTRLAAGPSIIPGNGKMRMTE